jgi:ABC-type multidrug transport system fused ATPase/permease subunit
MNFGTETVLKVNGPLAEMAYLKFDSPTPPDGKAVVNAKLRLNIADGSTDPQNINLVENVTWAETGATGITYDSRPAPAKPITIVHGGAAGTWIEADVTAAVRDKEGRSFSLAIYAFGGDSMHYYSKEAADKPELIVTYDTSDAVPPVAVGEEEPEDGSSEEPTTGEPSGSEEPEAPIVSDAANVAPVDAPVQSTGASDASDSGGLLSLPAWQAALGVVGLVALAGAGFGLLVRNGHGGAVLSPLSRLRARKKKPAKDQAGLVSSWKTISRLRRFAMPHRASIGFALLMLLGKAAMDLLKPWPLKVVVDDVITAGALEGETLELLVAMAVLIVAIACLAGLMTYVAAYVLNRAGRTMVAEMRMALFDHVQRLSLQFHGRRATGDLMARVTSDVEELREVMTDHLAEITYGVLFLVGMGVVLLWLDWQLSMVAIASGPLLFLALLWFTSEIQRHSRREKKRKGALTSVMHEALMTTRLSRAFNREDLARDRFEAESTASLESGMAATLTGERFTWLLEVVAAIITAAVLCFGTARVIDGALTIGSLIVFLSYVRDFYKPIKTVIRHTNKLARSGASAERVIEILDMKEGVVDRPDAVRAPAFRGIVEFKNVSFKYEGEHPVLRGLNLTLPAEKVTAIVGPTGTGKTTLLSLIPRLYDPTDGEILIDGEDIRAYTLQSLREQISVVFQESVLLRSSIAENIAYGRPSATMEEIIKAAKAVNVHDFIMALPEGYDTEVGERGETLSGGQRQLIAIARAMVRDTPIVILDEPVTGLDATSASAVMEALQKLVRGRTAIMITHQLSIAMQSADFLVVMENGRIIQQGTHKELVETEGKYRQLFQTQFKNIMEAVP